MIFTGVLEGSSSSEQVPLVNGPDLDWEERGEGEMYSGTREHQPGKKQRVALALLLTK